MKLSTRVRYGMRAAVEIGRSTENETPLNISHIADAQQLSVKYLESLLVQLRNCGILKSMRGKNGGYLLNRDSSQITVFEIVEALDGPVTLVNCEDKDVRCLRQDGCDTVFLWKHLSNTLINEMKKITLKNLIENNILEED